MWVRKKYYGVVNINNWDIFVDGNKIGEIKKAKLFKEVNNMNFSVQELQDIASVIANMIVIVHPDIPKHMESQRLCEVIALSVIDDFIKNKEV
ncbi:MAG: hypothetical protein ACOC1X_02175 [Promethearchaeota archaeon]